MPEYYPKNTATNPSDWLERHGDAMYRFALMRIRDSEAAEELVQEALLAACKNQATFSGQSSERTWLIAILKNKIMDEMRRRAKVAARHEEMDLEHLAPDPTFNRRGLWAVAVERWPESEAGTSGGAESGEFWAAFQGCLSGLPQTWADAFVLRELDGASTEEICKLLGVTSTNLWTMLHRGRTQLRACLEQNWFLK